MVLIIAEAGAKNATGEIKNFADDIDLLSSGLEARFEDINDQIDKVVKMLDITKYQLTRNDVFKMRNTLKNLEHNLTILKANFAGLKTYKMRVFINLLDKQNRFKIAKGYEIIKRFSENEALNIFSLQRLYSCIPPARASTSIVVLINCFPTVCSLSSYL